MRKNANFLVKAHALFLSVLDPLARQQPNIAAKETSGKSQITTKKRLFQCV